PCSGAIGSGNCLIGLHLASDLRDLARVLRVGGVAGLLQLLDETLGVFGAAQGRLITPVALQDTDVIVEALCIGVVGTEAGRFLDRLATLVFSSEHSGGLAVPTVVGLDAEQVMAALAIAGTDDRLAPAGFQRRLGH